MPPIVALILVISFILYLFYLHSKNGEKVSNIFWIFSFWFMMIGSRPLNSWLTNGNTDTTIITGTESNPTNIIISLSFGIISICVLIKRQVNLLKIFQQNIPLFTLLFYCLMSCAWSDDPLVSFRRFIYMFLNVFIVIAILSEPNMTYGIKKLFDRYAIFALPLSIVLIKYFPNISTSWNRSGDSLMWTGVSLHKNSFGIWLGACILFFVWKWIILKDFKTIKIDIFLFSLAAYMMFNPFVKGSSTSILSLLSALIFLISIKIFEQQTKTYIVVFYTLISFFFVSDLATRLFFNSSILEQVTLSSGRDMSFTGRTHIWDEVLKEASKSPILGNGYRMFWTGQRLDKLQSNPFTTGIYHSHNGYIETYADLGIIGLILLVITLVTSLNYHLTRLSSDYKYNSLSIAFLIKCMLSECFEASFLDSITSNWIILLIFILQVPRKQYKHS